MLGLILSLICLVWAAAYIFLKRRYNYWKNLGIPGPEPTMLVGNMKEFFSLKLTEPDMMQKWYEKYRKEPYIGYYNFWRPTLFIIDEKLVKAVLETDFNHFCDHLDVLAVEESDAVIDSLFNMNGSRWKAKRQLFSKLFSPKKLKELAIILEEHNNILMKEIDEQLKTDDEVNLMVIMEQQILKIITNFLYGIDTSNRERNARLSKLSATFARPNYLNVLRLLVFTVFPNICHKLKITCFPRLFWDYFSHFTRELFSSRNDAKVDRGDVVALIKRMQKEEVVENERIEYHEAVGHVFGFFIASHHTTMTATSQTIFQLSRYPEIQEKVRAEVDRVFKGKDSISYESLMELNYLEAVISESLRHYPLLGVFKRLCTKPYKVNDKFTIPAGTDVTIPAYSINIDPEYFPEPEKFIPERFTGEETMSPYFMSFGKGPRQCLGKRFARLSLKAIISRIVSEYEILPSYKTEIPIKFDTRTYFLTAYPAEGLYVRLKKRTK